MAGQGGVWREFLGSENQIFPRQPFPGEENFDFFLANPSPARKFFTFFLAMAGNWLIFVYFGEEFVCFGEEILARPPPGGKSFPKILARPPGWGKFLNFPRQILPDQTGEEKFLT